MSTFLRLALVYCLSATSASAADFVFRFNDAAGEGFNDLTPITAAQAGNNPATTLGQARRNLLIEAGRIWGAVLVSNVPIIVDAQFDPQTCNATGGTTLASAGARTFFRYFLPPPASPDTFFASALADSLAGEDLMQQLPDPSRRNNADIGVTFNTSVDSDPNCLSGRGFYYGFDNNKGNRIDALVVALHELSHGFGFASEIDLTDGTGFSSDDGIARFSTYVMQIFDETRMRSWPMLSPEERVASAVGNAGLAWNGSNVNNLFTAGTVGVTAQGRLRLFAPTPVSEGSSVSHWTTLVTSPDLLMEPNITATLTRSVDVTPCALRDIGWRTSRCPDIVVVPSPNAPSATMQTVSVLEDSPVVITLMATDPDPNTTLTYNTSTPARGVLTGTGNLRTYLPNQNTFGADSFTFTASDGLNSSAPATVSINVTPVNDAPTAASNNISTTSGQQTTAMLGGFDVDGDTLTFELISGTTNGTASLTANGALTYQSNARFTGTDSFTYRVRDASLTSSNTTVMINVAPATAPVPGGRGGGGGAMNELLLLALGLLAITARLYKSRMLQRNR